MISIAQDTRQLPLSILTGPTNEPARNVAVSLATTCRRAAERSADDAAVRPDKAEDFYSKSSFRKDFSLFLATGPRGMVVALLTNQKNTRKATGTHPTYRNGGRHEMATVYLDTRRRDLRDVLVCVSFDQAKREALEAGRPIFQTASEPSSPRPYYCKRMIVRRTV